MSKSHNLFNKLAQAAATTDGSSRKNMAKGTARVPGVAGPVGKKPPAVSGAGKVGIALFLELETKPAIIRRAPS